MSEGYICGIAYVDGTSCGLSYGHKGLCQMLIPPPDEYWEEDGEEEPKLPKESEPKQSRRTITLTFSDEDASLYDEILVEAKNDRRSPSQYLLLYLSKNHNVKEGDK